MMVMAVNGWGDELVAIVQAQAEGPQAAPLDAPLTHAVVIAEHAGSFLVVYHRARQRWELPAGRLEYGETPRACAVRELAEETGQQADDLSFVGCMGFRRRRERRVEYGALYRGRIGRLADFQTSAEIERVSLWDLKVSIDPMDDIDRFLVERYGRV